MAELEKDSLMTIGDNLDQQDDYDPDEDWRVKRRKDKSKATKDNINNDVDKSKKRNNIRRYRIHKESGSASLLEEKIKLRHEIPDDSPGKFTLYYQY